jgi:hypothetical protein
MSNMASLRRREHAFEVSMCGIRLTCKAPLSFAFFQAYIELLRTAFIMPFMSGGKRQTLG